MIPATPAGDDPERAISRATSIPLDSCWPAGAICSKTSVRVAWNPRELFVRADLDDEDVTTKATRDGEYLWQLGDVFEIFLEAEGAGYYTEMHVAPGNHRLHLRIRPEDYKAMKRKALSPSALMVRPPGFQSRFCKTPSGWSVEAIIPARLVDPAGTITPASRWKASFSRYDAWSDGRPPVLSSTSPHKEPNFHSRQDWRFLCF